MKNTTEQKQPNFKKWEKVINRMDFLVIIATIIYYVRIYDVRVAAVNNFGRGLLNGARIDYTQLMIGYLQFMNTLADHTGLGGILLLVFSLFIFSVLVYIAIRKYANREKRLGTLIVTLIWNVIWILGDVYILYLVLFS